MVSVHDLLTYSSVVMMLVEIAMTEVRCVLLQFHWLFAIVLLLYCVSAGICCNSVE